MKKIMNYVAPQAVVRNTRMRMGILAGSNAKNLTLDGKVSDFEYGARERNITNMD